MMYRVNSSGQASREQDVVSGQGSIGVNYAGHIDTLQSNSALLNIEQLAA